MNAPRRGLFPLILALVFCLTASSVPAQDLYDTTVLRTVALTFHDPNWLLLLRQNYQSQTNILADLVVDSVMYPDVGVRIRGNTSYWALPPGSEKFSLNVDVDFVHDQQDVLGYDSLNLNNGFHDPTFCREVVYNNYVAQFIPNPRANHVVVTLNGENWGVYVNVQQFDKTMLAPHFPDSDGLRIKCANNPNGPGLQYEGPDSTSYRDGYEIKDDGGLEDPWGALIDVCWAVTNGTSQESIDELFAIDPSIWSVALENLLTDDDSYIHKGADFMTYRDPVDGRMFLLQTDANEAFTQSTWSPTLNFSSSTKPVLSHVIDDYAEARRRYMAHYRTVMENLSWSYFEPIFTAHRDLIDQAVQEDPKKLYSYQQFLDNFTMTVVLPYGGPAGGPVIGLQPFVEQRASYLAGIAELNGSAPAITEVVVSDDRPDPEDPVVITATVAPGSSAISQVELFYRETPAETYRSVSMVNGGFGPWSVELPITASSGQVVSCYVGATSTNAYGSMSFLPTGTEWTPLTIEYRFSTLGMHITEWMYSGTNGEFIEFTNWSTAAIDMTGYSFDDAHQVAGAFDLSAFGVVQPYESVILTDGAAETFRAAWGLDPSVKIIGELGVTSGNNLGRNDELNLYDASSDLVDRLAYGDEDFPGTIRARDASGQTCCQALGFNDVTLWVLAVDGDSFGSWISIGGDVGTPGAYDMSECEGCGEIVAVPPLADATGMMLGTPRPNPFRSSAGISFGLEGAQPVRLAVFDVTGREIRRLVEGTFTTGEHMVLWDGRDAAGHGVAAGIYFIRLTSARASTTQKIVRFP